MMLEFSSAYSIDKYPDWFLYPKNYPDCITGFTFNGNSAFHDAELMLEVYEKCIITVYKDNRDIYFKDYFYTINQSYFIQKFNYYIDSTLTDSLYYVSGFCNDVLTNGIVQIYCKTNNSDSIKKNIKWFCVDSISPPSWINKIFWENDNFYYGVGSYTSIYNENKAWKFSEDNSIYSILSSVQLNIQNKMNYRSDNYSDILLGNTKIMFNFEVEGIEVLERHIDTKKQLFYTLTRIKKENIIVLK